MTRFTKGQMRLLAVCVAMYTALYLCRLNLSAALDAIIRGMNISIASGGLLQTVFALVYACGQIVNGAVADRVNPFRYMMLGLCGAALCNLCAGLCAAYPMLLIFWMGNAVFQSMLWTPIVRIVALHFSGLRERNAANAALAYSLIVGHFFAWAISGFMADGFSWRLSFLVPAVLALICAAVCAFFLPELRREGGALHAVRGKTAHAAPISSLIAPGFLLILASCVFYGFIRDGVITWTPTILAHIGREQAISATAFTLILPLINMVGVSLGVWQRGRGANPRVVVATMMIAGALCCAGLFAAGGLLSTALLLGGICAAMYGANTMLTGQIPLEFDAIGRTGTTAGLIDACIYLGSALSGVAGGAVYEHAGTGMLVAVWLGSSVLAGAMVLLSGKKKA